MDHTVLPANTPCLPFLRKRSPDGATSNWCKRHLIAAYYSSTDPERMKGWVDWLRPCGLNAGWNLGGEEEGGIGLTDEWCVSRVIRFEFSLARTERSEVRCTGVPGELYYVREGQVNDYALGFIIPLQTNVTQLFFNWFDDSSATDSAVKLSRVYD